jgi:hypothetical protein
MVVDQRSEIGAEPIIVIRPRTRMWGLCYVGVAELVDALG